MHLLPTGWPGRKISQHVKPIISKGSSRRSFCFFSVLSVSRSQFWSYDHENGIKLIPRTFGTNVSSRFLIEGLKIFFETFKVALQCRFPMFGCQNESKMASEISKIHF